MPNYRYNPLTNEFDASLAATASILPQLMWHITDRCPLSCPYCFATKTGLDTPLSKFDEIVEMCGQLGIQKVDLAGGEPLVFPALPAAAEALSKSGVALTLTTSGVGSESNSSWLLRNAFLFARIILSVDGTTAPSHDLLRGSPGTFDRVVNLISGLKGVAYNQIRINTVLLEPTAPRYQELIRTVSALHPNEWCLIQPHPANQKPTFDKYRMSDDAFAEAASRIEDGLLEAGSPIRLLTRQVGLYSGYWVLYPDGMLRRHSATGDDFEPIPFDLDHLAVVSALVHKLGVKVPTSRSGQVDLNA